MREVDETAKSRLEMGNSHASFNRPTSTLTFDSKTLAGNILCLNLFFVRNNGGLPGDIQRVT